VTVRVSCTDGIGSRFQPHVIYVCISARYAYSVIVGHAVNEFVKRVRAARIHCLIIGPHVALWTVEHLIAQTSSKRLKPHTTTACVRMSVSVDRSSEETNAKHDWQGQGAGKWLVQD
jgi:hypothetical protein